MTKNENIAAPPARSGWSVVRTYLHRLHPPPRAHRLPRVRARHVRQRRRRLRYPYDMDVKGYNVDVKSYYADVKGYYEDVKGYNGDVKGYHHPIPFARVC
eukprot:2152845-Pyramimonas_sp.AAC.1